MGEESFQKMRISNMIVTVAKVDFHVNPRTIIDQGLEYTINSPKVHALPYFDSNFERFSLSREI
jgi:hypothetical protein